MTLQTRLPLLAGLMLALAGCAASPSSCQLTPTVNVPVTFVGGLPTITAMVAGHELRFILDTGAESSTLTPQAVAKIDAQSGFFDGYGVGIGGRSLVGTSQPGDLRLDGLLVQGEQFKVVGLFKSMPARTEIDGLLGADILANYNLAFDFPHQRFQMFLRRTCPTAFPFKGDFADVPFRPSDYGSFSIPVTIDGHSVELLIDTGAHGTTLDQTTLAQAGVTGTVIGRAGTALGVGGKTTTLRHERFDSVTIGAEEADGAVLVVLSRSADDIPLSLLGEDYMRYHQVYISQDTGQVWLGLRIDPPTQDR
jgi:predicted aspartyl protease